LIAFPAGPSTTMNALEMADLEGAYADYLDSLEGRRSDEPLLSFEEFVARAQMPRVPADASTVPAPPDFGDDDIPF